MDWFPSLSLYLSLYIYIYIYDNNSFMAKSESIKVSPNSSFGSLRRI